MEIHLGHAGSVCPSRAGPGTGHDNDDNNAAEDVDEGSSHSEASSEDEEALGAGGNYSGWDDWGNGLPKLKGPDVLLIVDTTGCHRLKVHGCKCANAPPDDIQLLKMGLFPASIKKPSTVFTFRLLDAFRLENLESKTAANSFWQKVVRTTSNVFPGSVPVIAY